MGLGMTDHKYIIVEKRAPERPVGFLSDPQMKALHLYYETDQVSETFNILCYELREKGRWLVCNCVPDIPLSRKPAMTAALTQTNTLHLRNINDREPHASKCPLSYIPVKSRAHQPVPNLPRDLTRSVLNLHRGLPDRVTKPGKGSPHREPSAQRRNYPKLGQVMLHLMEAGGLLSIESDFDFKDALSGMRDAAGRLQAFRGHHLGQVLRLSVKREADLVEQIARIRKHENDAYGLLIAVVHEIDSGPTLIRRGKGGEVEWQCQPEGEVRIWAQRSIRKGPFLAAITYAADASGEVKPQKAFVLLAMDRRTPLPVESDLERTVARELKGLADWFTMKRDMTLSIKKPMFDIETPFGFCRPDFIVHGPGGTAVIEVMGMSDDPEYSERKDRQHPLMKELGELIEIAPSANGVLDEDDLSAMKRRVLAIAGYQKNA